MSALELAIIEGSKVAIHIEQEKKKTYPWRGRFRGITTSP